MNSSQPDQPFHMCPVTENSSLETNVGAPEEILQDLTSTDQLHYDTAEMDDLSVQLQFMDVIDDESLSSDLRHLNTTEPDKELKPMEPDNSEFEIHERRSRMDAWGENWDNPTLLGRNSSLPPSERITNSTGGQENQDQLIQSGFPNHNNNFITNSNFNDDMQTN